MEQSGRTEESQSRAHSGDLIEMHERRIGLEIKERKCAPIILWILTGVNTNFCICGFCPPTGLENSGFHTAEQVVLLQNLSEPPVR